MRVVAEIPNANCKITVFSWNNRYLIKLESSMMEQTFKINQFDLTEEADLYKILDETFIKEVINRFFEMEKSLFEAIQRSDLQ